jgi:hypothetical protein
MSLIGLNQNTECFKNFGPCSCGEMILEGLECQWLKMDCLICVGKRAPFRVNHFDIE